MRMRRRTWFIITVVCAALSPVVIWLGQRGNHVVANIIGFGTLAAVTFLLIVVRKPTTT